MCVLFFLSPLLPRFLLSFFLSFFCWPDSRRGRGRAVALKLVAWGRRRFISFYFIYLFIYFFLSFFISSPPLLLLFCFFLFFDRFALYFFLSPMAGASYSARVAFYWFFFLYLLYLLSFSMGLTNTENTRVLWVSIGLPRSVSLYVSS